MKRLTVAPGREQNEFQKRDTNWGPRLDTTFQGKSWRRNTGEEGGLDRGMCHLGKSVTTVRMEDCGVAIGGGHPFDKFQKDV